jgi:hypothetical protein
MKNMLVTILFMLATLAWAVAQQPRTAPSSQTPDANQSQPSTPGSSGQGQASDAPVTQGCLGGSDPNFTLTDSASTTYKLNIPPNADTSKLAAHLGESVLVKGDVKDLKTVSPSIDVQGIGRGTGKCPASDSKGAQSPPKQ